MQLGIRDAAEYLHLQQVATQLPSLCSMRLCGSRKYPPPPPAPHARGYSTYTAARAAAPAVLPQLQAMSFAGKLTSLRELCAMAPNLQDLYCYQLELHNADTVRRLPNLRTLAACLVTGRAATALPDLFPQLSATYQLPETQGDLARGSSLPAKPYSAPGWPRVKGAANLCAMRLLEGDQLWMPRIKLDADFRVQLRQLRCLVWHGMVPNIADTGLTMLTNLESLAVSYIEVTGKASVERMMKDVATLPRLQRLVLPATLLCGSCMPWGHDMLMQFLQQPSQQQLSKLVFLARTQGAAARRRLGAFCKHIEGRQDGLEQLITSLSAAAPNRAGQQLHVEMVCVPSSIDHVGLQPGHCVLSGQPKFEGVWGWKGAEWYL